MNTAPIAGFRYRANALRVQQALHVAGIRSEIREPGEAPPGWRMARFTIWVAQEEEQGARSIIRETIVQAGEVICSWCGAAKATIHIARCQDGGQTTTHLCDKCQAQT